MLIRDLIILLVILIIVTMFRFVRPTALTWTTRDNTPENPDARALFLGPNAMLFLIGSILCVGFLWNVHIRHLPAFFKLFQNMGAQLPAPTLLVIKMAFPIACTLVVWLLDLLALTLPKQPATRTKLLFASFLSGILAVAIQSAFLYMPIFALSANIRN